MGHWHSKKTSAGGSLDIRTSKKLQIITSIIILVISTGIALGLGEVILRVKNSSMKNYDIEMWRYALELKKRSDIPLLGHEHVSNATATLQSIEIRINERGLRGGEIEKQHPARRILFLGSSVTLGWGVPEKETVTARVSEYFSADGQKIEVLNGGIGNYNAVRYVKRFKSKLADLEPTDIVVHYFLRDAVVLDAGGGNFLLRHSQLAVTTWSAINRFIEKNSTLSLQDYYRQVYSPQADGFIEMRKALHELSLYARQKNIRIIFAMTPDVHDLVDYKFDFIHDQMRAIALEEGYVFVDLLPSMKNLTPSELWSMPGDPHPNSLGHERMAKAIYPVLKGLH